LTDISIAGAVDLDSRQHVKEYDESNSTAFMPAP